MTAAGPGPAPVTPGRAAYEAPIIMCNCTQVPELPPCEHLMPGWEAAAQAAIDESDSIALDQLAMAQEALSDLAAERDEARAGRDGLRARLADARERLAGAERQCEEDERTISDYRDAFTAMQRERDEARAGLSRMRELVIEILCTYAGDTGNPGVLTSLASPGQRDRWRQRAGLDGS